MAAQSRHDYTWLFIGGNTPNAGYLEGSHIDFNNNKVDVYWKEMSKIFIGQNNTQMCDENGKLIFWSNGCVVVDSTRQIMENGDKINYGNSTYDDFCESNLYLSGDYPGVQAIISLPDPLNEKGYYIIHNPQHLVLEPLIDVYTPELRYSYVDMSLNDGKGAITDKNVVFYKDKNITIGYLTAVRHANLKDWWIIDNVNFSNEKLVFLLNENGINLVDTISIGLPTTTKIGQATFSPDGTKYLRYEAEYDLQVFDFDRSTGKLSNAINLPIEENKGSFYGVAISPNNRFAYLSSSNKLFQVDLWEENLEDGLVLIDTLVEGPSFHLAQLGPDCKIYITGTSFSHYLNVINNPDEKGLACNYEWRGIKLPYFMSIGSLPNYPHFRTGEDQVCDPNIVSSIPWLGDALKEISIYPNPTQNTLNIKGLPLGKYSYKILNTQGVKVLEGKLNDENINSSSLENGMYFLQLWNDKGVVFVDRFIKME
jgi:hypothetical protein